MGYLNIEQKTLNIIDSEFIFDHIEKSPDNFYFVKTLVPGSNTYGYKIYLGEEPINIIPHIATEKSPGLILSNEYIKIMEDGSPMVLKSNRLAKSVKIGNAEFDGSKSIEAHDLGVSTGVCITSLLETDNWHANSGDYAFANVCTISMSQLPDYIVNQIKEENNILKVSALSANSSITYYKACETHLAEFNSDDTNILLTFYAKTKPVTDLSISIWIEFKPESFNC